MERSHSFIAGVVYVGVPLFNGFVDVVTDVKPSYAAGSVVEVTFVGTNPRNNPKLEDTYATVEKWNETEAGAVKRCGRVAGAECWGRLALFRTQND